MLVAYLPGDARVSARRGLASLSESRQRLHEAAQASRVAHQSAKRAVRNMVFFSAAAASAAASSAGWAASEEADAARLPPAEQHSELRALPPCSRLPSASLLRGWCG